MPITLRDQLAIDRTHLANRRTLLAFIRTGLYLLMTAAAVWNLEILEQLRWLGEIAIGVGLLIMIFGVVSYLRMRTRIITSYQSKVN